MEGESFIVLKDKTSRPISTFPREGHSFGHELCKIPTRNGTPWHKQGERVLVFNEFPARINTATFGEDKRQAYPFLRTLDMA
jgi:hypothetical protein